jgi:hypothetical protein
VANSGSGGGGASSSNIAGNGGSGIVVISYYGALQPPTISLSSFTVSGISTTTTVSVTDAGADSIVIQYYQSAGLLDRQYSAFGGTPTTTISPATGSDSYTNTTITSGRWYYAVVTAINTAGSTSITTSHIQAL